MFASLKNQSPTKTGKDSLAPAGCLFPLEVKTPDATAVRSQLVLSLFPGIGLLDRGFEDAGFTVVRGPDAIWGGDIKKFHAAPGHFSGVIGGPPCQKFSMANRNRDIAGGMILVNEFLRVVDEAKPVWWLMENVPGSPSVTVPGYVIQRFTLDASQCGSEQKRLRKFHFGYQPGLSPLIIQRMPATSQLERTVLASEGRRGQARSWQTICALQGLPDDFDLVPFKLEAKRRAVGNGVPYPMALALAQAVAHCSRYVTPQRLCYCGCGEVVTGKQKLASMACRKRVQRQRDELKADAPKQFGLVMQLALPAIPPPVDFR
jgi:DNA (cytosine-5)-methyltransferase 1